MKTSEILIKAKKIIQSPIRWTKATRARNVFGDMTEPLSEDATCFCSIGAVEKALDLKYNVYFDMYRHPVVKFLDSVTKEQTLGRSSKIWGFNDLPNTTHEDILKIFDVAINKAKEQESQEKKLETSF